MTLRHPHWLVCALCVGLASANVLRTGAILAALVAATAAVGAAVVDEPRRTLMIGLALVLGGWWWGSARLDALDRSILIADVGRAGRARVVVTAPPRRGQFEIRANARVERFERRLLQEAVLLQLPRGRAPPQGAVLEVLARVQLPRGPEDGFDERTWLGRHGSHVVLAVDEWRAIGRRGGVAGATDRLRAWLGRTVATGLDGERRGILTGVVLGDDQALSQELRDRFRASGLYHLLAVSGQNVALVAGGTLVLAWLLGIPRVAAEVAALASMAAYVLAVVAQPSVVRAGIAGALGSLAWLTARTRDRWYFLLLGALALLAWNPYVLLDPGFQLSFVAVAAIFVAVPPLRRRLDGYPLPGWLADTVAVSTACGVATAPVLWVQFHAIPLLAVPTNALAAPVMAPLLWLAIATVAAAPLSPTVAASLAWLNGWCAAYLAACARLVGGLPGAQLTSGAVAAVLAAGAVALAAYAWPRWRISSRSTSSAEPTGRR